MPIIEKTNCTGLKLKEKRLKAGISRNLLSQMVSEICPISEALINSIENGTAPIYDFQLYALSKVLDIPVDEFFAD